jgi:hypothetical protein
VTLSQVDSSFQIATGVIIAWVHTIYEQFGLLAGKSAPNEFIQLVIYKAMTFSADIDKIDTVRAYHSGPVCSFSRMISSLLIPTSQDYFVEVDIVMDALTPLWKAHDISQQLQDKLEDLPNVERAFVHVDHETTHAPVCLSILAFADDSHDGDSGTSQDSVICSCILHVLQIFYLLFCSAGLVNGYLISDSDLTSSRHAVEITDLVILSYFNSKLVVKAGTLHRQRGQHWTLVVTSP